MANVFYTWLGPPQQANKTISGLEGQHRPDLFGILRTAKSRFKNFPPPRFVLCVLKKFQGEFDTQLPSFVETLAVDDSFATSQYHSIMLSAPNLDDLDLTVDYIMRETIKVRGTGYPNSQLPYGKLAFVKDLWCLYAVWKYGGYHLDSGIFPFPEGGLLDFPEPTGFDAPTIDNTDCRGEAKHCTFTFATGKPICVTTTSKTSNFETLAMNGRITVKGTTGHLQRLLDVWMVRSPAGDPSAKRALEVYVRGWFEIQAWAKNNADKESTIKELMRELVVFATMTGVTHAGTKHKCASKREVDSHIINGFNKLVPDMGLKKVGFQSHR